MTDLKEYAENADVHKALSKALKKLDEAKRTKEELVEAVYQAARDAAAGVAFAPVKNLAKPSKGKGDPETAVVVLSDWQLGKTTPTYDSDVCAERIETLAHKVRRLTEIQRADHPVKDCRVYALGDFCEGELIFPGQAHRIDSSLFRQVMLDGPQIFGGFLREMLATFETVTVVGVIGNHGAIGGRSRREMHPESNADAMLYEATRLRLGEQPRLTWRQNHTPDERHWYAIDEVHGKRFMLVHGDQIRGGFGGFPFYGYAKKALGWYSSVERFDYLLTGHWHTPTKMTLGPGIKVWVNGSTESTNTYAQENLATSGSPSQWLLFVSDNGVAAEYEVRL